MTKESTYTAKLPEPDGTYLYTPEEDAIWGELYQRQMKLLADKACDEYLEGARTLNLGPDHVDAAQHHAFAGVDAKVQETKWPQSAVVLDDAAAEDDGAVGGHASAPGWPVPVPFACSFSLRLRMRNSRISSSR